MLSRLQEKVVVDERFVLRRSALVDMIVHLLQDLIQVTAANEQINDNTVSRLKFLCEQVSLLFV